MRDPYTSLCQNWYFLSQHQSMIHCAITTSCFQFIRRIIVIKFMSQEYYATLEMNFALAPHIMLQTPEKLKLNLSKEHPRLLIIPNPFNELISNFLISASLGPDLLLYGNMATGSTAPISWDSSHHHRSSGFNSEKKPLIN